MQRGQQQRKSRTSTEFLRKKRKKKNRLLITPPQARRYRKKLTKNACSFLDGNPPRCNKNAKYTHTHKRERCQQSLVKNLSIISSPVKRARSSKTGSSRRRPDPPHPPAPPSHRGGGGDASSPSLSPSPRSHAAMCRRA